MTVAEFGTFVLLFPKL